MSVTAIGLVWHSRRLGMRVVAHEALARAWSAKPEFELVSELETKPETPAAALPVTMRAIAPATFQGFDRELNGLSGHDYGQALRRVLACRANVDGLHVALDGHGEPIYAQWLLDEAGRLALASHARGPWRPLRPDESLVEYAYTFHAHRGRGAMAAGMGQLLDYAAAAGKRRVVTYVRPDNIASLRGCERVGFVPQAIVVSSMRFGRYEGTRRAVTDEELRVWAAATAPRG